MATLPLTLIFDLASGLLGEGVDIPVIGLSPSEILRGGFVVASCLVLIVSRHAEIRGVRRSIIGLGMLGLSALVLSGSGPSSLLGDVEALVEVLFGPLMVVLFVYSIVRFDVSSNLLAKATAGYGAFAGLLLLGSSLLGIGSRTYGSHGLGFSGLFGAKNALALALVMASASAAWLVAMRPRYRTLLVLAGAMGALLILGTRVSTIGAILVPFFVLLVAGTHHLRSWRRLPLAIASASLLSLTLAGAVSQRVNSIQESAYDLERYQALLAGQVFRAGRVDYALDRLTAHGVRSIFVGLGPSSYRQALASTIPGQGRTWVEMDWIDLAGSFGVLFTLAMYWFYGRPLVRAVRSSLGHPRSIWTPVAAALGVFMLHSIVAGHAIVDPVASNLAAPFVALAVGIRSGRIEAR